MHWLLYHSYIYNAMCKVHSVYSFVEGRYIEDGKKRRSLLYSVSVHHSLFDVRVKCYGDFCKYE